MLEFNTHEAIWLIYLYCSCYYSRALLKALFIIHIIIIIIVRSDVEKDFTGL